MSAPIPVRLLPHSATYESYIKTVNSCPTYEAGVTLLHVRFESVKQTAMTALGDMKNDRFTLYYDCRNSLPEGISFKKGDRITVGDMALSVRTAKPCYGREAAIHHWEVACV